MPKPLHGKADSEGFDRLESTVLACYSVAFLLHEKDLHKCGEKSNISGPLSSGTVLPSDRRAIPGPSPYARPVFEFPPNVCNPILTFGFSVPVYRFDQIRLEGLSVGHSLTPNLIIPST